MMNLKRSKSSSTVGAVLAAFVLGAATPPVAAADGIIEINQAKVNAAGGFPYVISQPGSYKLTSNLTQAASNTLTFIQISADNVTLDLNGFSIVGGNTCTLSGSFPTQTLSCATTGGAHGIASAKFRTMILNGNVQGVGGTCVDLTNEQSRLERVSVSHCGDWGAFVSAGSVTDVSAAFNAGDGVSGTSATVKNSRAFSNGGMGVFANSVSGTATYGNLGPYGIRANTVEKSSAQFNQGTGITGQVVADSDSSYNSGSGIGNSSGISAGVVRNSTATFNTGNGIYASGAIGNLVQSNGGAGVFLANGGTAIGNAIFSNAGFGIQTLGAVGASQNVLKSNTLGDVSGNVLSVPANSNVCNSGLAC